MKPWKILVVALVLGFIIEVVGTGIFITLMITEKGSCERMTNEEVVCLAKN